MIKAARRLFEAFRGASSLMKALVCVALVYHICFLVSPKWKLLNGLSYDMKTFKAVRGVDFNAVYMAGRYAREGRNLYTVPYYEAGVPHTRFRYTPPVAFVLGVPFSLIPNFLTASKIWVLITEVLFVINILLSVRFCANERRILAATLLWLCFFPYAVEIYMGQFSFLTASLVFWSVLALWRNRRPLSTLLWLPAILLKIFPLCLLPIFWRKAGSVNTLAALTLISLLTVPYFLTHPTDAQDFITLNLQIGTAPPTVPYLGNQGFYHLALQILKGAPEETIRLLPFIFRVAGFVLLCLFLYLCLTGKRDIISLFAIGMVLFFIISPEVWEHHYVLLMPFFVLYFITREKVGGGFIAAYILCALPTLFIFLDLSGPFGTGKTLPLNSLLPYVYFTIKPLGVLIFFVILIRGVSHPIHNTSTSQEGKR